MRFPIADQPSVVRPTRDEVLRLAAGRPWEFLAPAHAYLAHEPQDHDIRLLAAAHLIELRLKAFALDHLELLPAEYGASEDARHVRAAAESLRSDLVALDTRVGLCRRNLDALGARADPLRDHFEPWIERRARRVRVHRAKDGNTIIVDADTGQAPLFFVDRRAAAARAEINPPQTDRPALLISAPSGWLLERALRAQAPTGDGRHPAVLVVAENPFDLFDAFATLDMTAVLRESRLRAFVDKHAVDELRARLLERPGDRLPVIVENPSADLAPGVLDGLLDEVAAHRLASFDEYKRRVSDIYAGKDRAWWEAHFRKALQDRTPLRVLTLTSRFSTFLRHSIEDIAGALQAAGHETLPLAEPDDESSLTSLTTMAAVSEFRPDLILAINFPRAALNGLFPEGVPFACWIQDAMPHLFSAKVGDAQTGLDFVVGHLHPSLFGEFGYPVNRAIRTPVLASSRKFHAAPISGAARREFSCDLAYVGNQSETVGAQRARFLAQEPPGPVRDAIEFVAARVAALIESATTTSPYAATTTLAEDALRHASGSDPSQNAIAAFRATYAAPMVDRAFRHQALVWASEIATARSWEFRIHGRGWDRHPTLHEFARPPLDHGDDLRACYQAATAHLHVSSSTLAHQRVMECALSGGLPLCRLHLDEVWAYTLWCAQQCLVQGLPANGDPSSDDRRYAVAGRDFLARLMSLRRSLGIEPSPEFVVGRWLRDWAERLPPLVREQQAEYFLGDLPSVTFRSYDSLEALLGRAVEDRVWRTEVVGGIRERVGAHLTYEGFIPSMLRQITSMLADPVRR